MKYRIGQKGVCSRILTIDAKNEDKAFEIANSGKVFSEEDIELESICYDETEVIGPASEDNVNIGLKFV
jgi:hypothetical protein